MTLEDFFTLTEMKDGLTSLSRVEELVTVMRKEKDCSVNNVGDASRQWTAVASTIAATENQDCLDLFIKLEGLLFIDKWLKEAQKFCTDTEESFLEESIVALLQALEKLHINCAKSVSSGIWITVKDLLDHKSSTVQDRARMLFACWEHGKDNGVANFEVEEDRVKKIEGSHGDQSSKLVLEDFRPSSVSNRTSEETSDGDTHMAEPSGELKPHNVSSDLQLERSNDILIDAQSNQVRLPKFIVSADIKERVEHPLASSIKSSSIQESPCPIEDSSASSLAEAPAESISVTPKSIIPEEQRDHLKEGRYIKLEKQDDKVEGSVSSPPKSKVAQLDIDAKDSQDPTMRQSTLQQKLEADVDDGHTKYSEIDCGITKSATDSKGMPGESMVFNHCMAVEDGECCSNALQKSSLNDCTVGEDEDLEKVSRLNLGGTDGEDKDNASDDDEDRDFRNAYKFSKPVMDKKCADAINKRRSDDELYYGVDALEVARQVAKAVEREVGDFRGTLCSSSSEKTSDDGSKRLGSPESINEKPDLPSKTPRKEATTGQSRPRDEINVADQDRAPDNSNHDFDSSHVTEGAQETEMNAERGLCGFDLNEDVCSDEMDNPLNLVSTTISVSASRPVTAPGFPAAPLQFEGALGWRGSAATSAFRPASPRKNSDSDKNPSVGVTSDGSSKQRQDWLDFDLNVAEGGDDPGKQITALSSHPSGESSVEVSPKISERFKLDLNRIDDDGDVVPPNSRLEEHHLFIRNGLRSPSPSSLSSLMQQSLRNFDLNDRPSFNDPQDHQGPGKSTLTADTFSLPEHDASVISILGARVAVNKRDTVPQTLSLSNGKAIVEPTGETAATITGSGSFLGLAPAASYTHSSPFFGFNGMTTSPTMSISPGLYGPGGPIPCIMDSRAMAMPQLVQPGSSISQYSQPPFMMSMSNAQLGLNGAGPSRPNFDLNSGFMVEGANREMGLRQFFVPGPARALDDHLRMNSQPSASSSGGVGGKRKEPDGGWEPFQFTYKQPQQQQPPWR